MKKVLIILVVLVIAGFAAFTYATRDLAAPSAPVGTDDAEPVATAGVDVYVISNTGSRAQYELDETLKGSPKHVVGTTAAVTGQIEVEAGVVTIGDIAVNARTFTTDSEKRDNAVGRYILKSEELANEFITLRNIVVTGASGLMEAGKTVIADATGDLTIAGVTKPTTFRVEGALKDGGFLEGTAIATVKRSDFALKIPELESVANVSDEVLLTITIRAIK
jgi:polyisoprenoid-binding protein YceI